MTSKTKPKQQPSALQLALKYIALGISPIPIPWGLKGPTLPGWPELRITAATAEQYFNGAEQNIGMLPGPPSKGIVDVDLDCAAAVRLAPHFLPPTAMRYGRGKRPNSHYLYRCKDKWDTLAFRDPDAKEEPNEKAMLVELRGEGHIQSVLPGSWFAKEDDHYRFELDGDGEPMQLEYARLSGCVHGLAAACLIEPHWREGKRNDLNKAVAGSLLRGGMDPSQVSAFIKSIVLAANDEKALDERLEAAESLARGWKSPGQKAKVPGRPSLTEIIGEAAVREFYRWMGLEQEEPWGKPHDFLHETPAPPLDVEDVPAVIGAYAKAWESAQGYEATGVMVACVVAASTALTDEIQLAVRPGYSEPARVWAGLLGPPGIAKTPGIKAATRPLEMIQVELNQRNQDALDLWRASRPKGKEDSQPPPALMSVLTHDSTVEALCDVLSANRGGILYLAHELDSWLGNHDAYRASGGSRDRGEWLQLYDGGPHQVNRVNRGSMFVPNWAVSLLSATTPDALKRLASKLISNDGLLQRVLMFVMKGTAARPNRQASFEVEYVPYQRMIEKLYSYRGHGGDAVVQFSDEAYVLFEEREWYYRQLAPACNPIHAGLAGHVAKYGGMLARITLTFHAIECAVGNYHPANVPVGVDTVKLAGRFLSKAFAHARAVYDLLSDGETDTALNIARRVGVALVADRKDEISRRELVHSYPSFRGANKDHQQEAMRLLEDFGWCRVQPGKHNMGYPNQWSVNPQVHVLFARHGEEWLARRALVKAAILGGSVPGEG